MRIAENTQTWGTPLREGSDISIALVSTVQGSIGKLKPQGTADQLYSVFYFV
jgi:hypothetical protein